jgi:hypothetical protein
MYTVCSEKHPCPVCKTGTTHIIRESASLPVVRLEKEGRLVVLYLKCPTCHYTWPVRTTAHCFPATGYEITASFL